MIAQGRRRLRRRRRLRMTHRASPGRGRPRPEAWSGEPCHAMPCHATHTHTHVVHVYMSCALRIHGARQKCIVLPEAMRLLFDPV